MWAPKLLVPFACASAALPQQGTPSLSAARLEIDTSHLKKVDPALYGPNHLCTVQVSEEEAAAGALGPEWPAPEVLRALQRQCVDISHAAQSREHSPCAKRLIMSLLATLHGTNCLLDRMHYFPTRSQSGERLAAEQAVERLQRAAGAYERESA